MIEVGIIGGAGYTAGELIRLLINHPKVHIHFIHSTSNAGNQVSDVHAGLLGEIDMLFTDQLPLDQVQALFLCSAHGDSKKFLDNNTVPPQVKIIDLSTDYRHKASNEGFVYGLPELNKAALLGAQKVANPGCFATAIQLALLPLASKQLLQAEVHIQAITGSTGAGVKPSATTHFSWRDNNLSVYKAFEHQHLKEITESLVQAQPSFNQTINFIPLRGDFPRGIFVSCYTQCEASQEELERLYRQYYQDSPFTVVASKSPDLKQVVNTNKCVVYVQKHGNKVLLLSVIDNLLKGASGQAVENFNLMFGLAQKEGLALKPSAF